MDRIVSPPRSELHKLRQELEPGEWKVFEFFDTYLDPAWEIYIQPHMNGLRPDFVLLNPNVGIAVFEVKNWDFSAVKYWVEERDGRPPILLASKGGRTFSKQNENPVEKVYQYKQELFSLYCPRLQQRNGFAVITAGVIFPSAEDNFVKALFHRSLLYRGMEQFPRYNPISGNTALTQGNLSHVFPEGMRMSSKFMNPELANDLRYWLVEPDFAATQRIPLELDTNQRALATSRTKSGYRRIRGAAGSGKSLVLAARAAELLGEGKQVLVVTFNITLLHYLMDMAVRWPKKQGNTRKDVTWLNFHSWCKRVCVLTGHSNDYHDLWARSGSEQNVLDIALPRLVSEILDSADGNLATKYDAVLVDEGQDFLPSWWDALRKVCKPEGEMLLVADATQDIYETASSWTDEAMTGAGFRGEWAELPISYRMPHEALEKAKEFAQRYLPSDKVFLPQGQQGVMDLEPCSLRWVQCSSDRAAKQCFDELMRFFKPSQVSNPAISDATFLCSHKEFGQSVVKELGGRGINVVHTFHPDDQESRRQKMGFYMGDARVKATTLHSFKGWESRLLVVYIGESISPKDLALIYTGLTRLKRSVYGSCLTVVCSAKELESYGATWPEFDKA